MSVAAAFFADTSFWIALTSRRDQYHAQAVAWSRHVVQSKVPLVTTEAVLWEWMNGLSDRATRSAAIEGYRRCHRDSQIEVIAFHPENIEAAVKLYEQRSDKNWSLTDCLSFVVISERGISQALTSDHHFEQAGAKALLLADPAVL